MLGAQKNLGNCWNPRAGWLKSTCKTPTVPERRITILMRRDRDAPMTMLFMRLDAWWASFLTQVKTTFETKWICKPTAPLPRDTTNKWRTTQIWVHRLSGSSNQLKLNTPRSVTFPPKTCYFCYPSKRKKTRYKKGRGCSMVWAFKTVWNLRGFKTCEELEIAITAKKKTWHEATRASRGRVLLHHTTPHHTTPPVQYFIDWWIGVDRCE